MQTVKSGMLAQDVQAICEQLDFRFSAEFVVRRCGHAQTGLHPNVQILPPQGTLWFDGIIMSLFLVASEVSILSFSDRPPPTNRGCISPKKWTIYHLTRPVSLPVCGFGVSG
jgi:hypothetical protein